MDEIEIIARKYSNLCSEFESGGLTVYRFTVVSEQLIDINRKLLKTTRYGFGTWLGLQIHYIIFIAALSFGKFLQACGFGSQKIK